MMSGRVMWIPVLLVLGMFLTAGSAEAGLIADTTDQAESFPKIQACELFEIDPLCEYESLMNRSSQMIFDLSSEWIRTQTATRVDCAYPAPEWIKGVITEQKGALPLIGLTLFRSRNSKKQFRPISDSDEWQIIYKLSSMVC
ncbi:MAG: hypothetical protein JXA82_18845 [Sedimentisphaerales bacterium]|nr:hypothetical protein [Sedimentisphaerales bacterium]